MPLPENKPDAETEPVGARGRSDSPAVQFPTVWVPDSTALTAEAGGPLPLPSCPAHRLGGYRRGDLAGLHLRRAHRRVLDRGAASSTAAASHAVRE